MSDIKKGLPIRTEEDIDKKVQIKIHDFTDPDGSEKQVEVSEKLMHNRTHGEDPAGTKVQLKLSETGAPNSQGEYDLTDNTKPASAGMVVHDRTTAPDETDQNVRITGVNDPEDDTVHALDVAIRDGDGKKIDEDNPLPVTFAENPGDEVHDYDEAVDVASDATSNHDYVVADGDIFLLDQILCSASSRMKYELQIGDGAVSETFTTKAVRFQSEEQSDSEICFKKPIKVIGTANGTTVRVIRTNRDNQAQSIYSTIVGVTKA